LIKAGYSLKDPQIPLPIRSAGKPLTKWWLDGKYIGNLEETFAHWQASLTIQFVAHTNFSSHISGE
jgi:hypothetical protein